MRNFNDSLFLQTRDLKKNKCNTPFKMYRVYFFMSAEG